MAKPIGISPKNPKDYLGPSVTLIPTVDRDRDPAGTDYKYPIQTIWHNNVTLDEWILVDISANVGNWKKFTSGSGGTVVDFTVPFGTTPVVPTAAGNVALTSTANTITITGGLNTINFDLAGGGVAVDQINVDASTPPGTDPVVPDGTGQITVTGAQVAAGVVGANVIRTDSLAANTYTIEIQRSTAVAASDSVNNGVSHFNNAPGQFTVDAAGFVSTNGSGNLLWVNQTSDLDPLVKGTAYQANKAGTACALTLPTGATFGDTIRVQGFGATGWILNAGVGQTIQVESGATTVAGSVTVTNQYDYIEVVCSSTTTTWFATAHGGNLTLA